MAATNPVAMLFLWLIPTAPAFAQFRNVTISFVGSGCESCISSLPERLQRIRGVETAAVRDGSSVVIALAAENRVRLEQLRDLIEQDGTRTTAAAIQVRGELMLESGQWLLQLPQGSGRYSITSADPTSLTRGTCVIRGSVEKLRPATGHITIHAAAIENGK